jgi:hypothetical protein
MIAMEIVPHRDATTSQSSNNTRMNKLWYDWLWNPFDPKTFPSDTNLSDAEKRA